MFERLVRCDTVSPVEMKQHHTYHQSIDYLVAFTFGIVVDLSLQGRDGLVVSDIIIYIII